MSLILSVFVRERQVHVRRELVGTLLVSLFQGTVSLKDSFLLRRKGVVYTDSPVPGALSRHKIESKTVMTPIRFTCRDEGQEVSDVKGALR